MSFAIVEPHQLRLFGALFSRLGGGPCVQRPVRRNSSLSSGRGVGAVVAGTVGDFSVRFTRGVLGTRDEACHCGGVGLRRVWPLVWKNFPLSFFVQCGLRFPSAVGLCPVLGGDRWCVSVVLLCFDFP